jgi:hypothetical protein
VVCVLFGCATSIDLQFCVYKPIDAKTVAKCLYCSYRVTTITQFFTVANTQFYPFRQGAMLLKIKNWLNIGHGCDGYRRSPFLIILVRTPGHFMD